MCKQASLEGPCKQACIAQERSVDQAHAAVIAIKQGAKAGQQGQAQAQVHVSKHAERPLLQKAQGSTCACMHEQHEAAMHLFHTTTPCEGK